MAKKLLVMCASRSRPSQLNRMIQSVFSTSDEADVAVFVDDDQTDLYRAIDPRAMLQVGKREGQCAALNTLYHSHPGYLAYGAATDDCEFKSPGWDQWVLRAIEHLPRGVGAVAPRCETDWRMDFPWLTEAWLKVLGEFCPAGTLHEYWDVVLELLAEQVGIVYARKGEFDIVHHSEPATDTTDNGQMLATEMAIWVLKNAQDGRYACAWLAHNRRPVIAQLRKAAGV